MPRICLTTKTASCRTDESEKRIDGRWWEQSKTSTAVKRATSGTTWENGENFKGLNERIPVAFFRSYIEKNSPVRMEVEEMKAITAEEAGF